MIPILYENNETVFTTNGLGRLSDCLSCLVSESRNSEYEVEFTYPVSGIHFDDITIGRIIACTHDEQGDVQPFDIYAKSEPINGVVTFHARHISYRLNGFTVKPFSTATCAGALAGLISNSIGTNPFTTWTDKTTGGDYVLEAPNGLRGLLVGEENSILDVFGSGEYEFDKFTIKLHNHRGNDTNVFIRYGKNLVDFNNDYDAGSIYTAVVPYWLGTVNDASVLVTLPEWYISSGHSSPGGREIMIPMDLSSEFSDQPTVNELRTLATSRLSGSDAWEPTQTLNINFVQLWQTEEYKDYAPLQRLRLCDTCGVVVPMYNLSVRLKVIRVVYNTLLDRYDSMELGDKPTTYTAIIEETFDSKVAGVVEGFRAEIGSIVSDANDYTDEEIAALRSDIETQIDAKLETWAQSTNPAVSWTTSELKAEHNGDLWLYTGTSSITVGGVTIHPQGVYQYNGSTNTWAAYSSTSNNLFDLVDGKSTIFYGTPSGTYNNKEVGDYLVDNSTGSTYRWSGSAWVKQTDYATAISNATTNITNAYEQAIADATALIRGGTGGYVVTTVDANGKPIELLITDNLDLNQAIHVWRWNQNGIGYSSNGYNGPYTSAWTIDGHFNADFITTGAINANLITTGLLNADLIRAGIIQDASAKNYWNLTTGQLVTKQGQLGTFTIDSYGLIYDTTSKYVCLDNYGLDVREFSSSRSEMKGVNIGTNSIEFFEKRGASSIWDDDSALEIGVAYTGGGTTYYPSAQIYSNGKRYINFLYYGSYNQPIECLYGVDITGNVVIHGGMTASGTKSRSVDTDNYSERLLYCYETPTPIFGDIGEAVIDADGLAYVDIDDILSEAIASRVEYQVFLQKEGAGDCWISEKQPRYFVIEGTPGLRVAWELKAKQRDYEMYRLEDNGLDLDVYERADDVNLTLDRFIEEQEGLLYD